MPTKSKRKKDGSREKRKEQSRLTVGAFPPTEYVTLWLQKKKKFLKQQLVRGAKRGTIAWEIQVC